jgi:hypothetical protein
VAPEKPEAELKRLLKEQHKARQDEVFGGLSPAERAEYEGKANRIHALESEIQASAVSKNSSLSAKAEQERFDGLLFRFEKAAGQAKKDS